MKVLPSTHVRHIPSHKKMFFSCLCGISLNLVMVFPKAASITHYNQTQLLSHDFPPSGSEGPCVVRLVVVKQLDGLVILV